MNVDLTRRTEALLCLRFGDRGERPEIEDEAWRQEESFFLLPSAAAEGVGKPGSCSLMVDGDVVSMVTDFFSSRSAAKSSNNNKNPSQLSLAIGGDT